MKRIISILLLFFMVTTTLTPLMVSFADIGTKIVQAKPFKGDIDDPGILMNKVSLVEVKDYLSKMGYEMISENGLYYLNPYVYWKYKVIAYTNASALTELSNDEENSLQKRVGLTSTGSPVIRNLSDLREVYEYRFLGYKVDGTTIITNDFYPADSKNVSKFVNRSWVEADEDLDSWSDNLRDNSNLINHILFDPLYNDDDTSGIYEKKDYSIYDAIKISNIDTLMKYPIIMQEPSFGEGGMYNMTHKSASKIWYDTVQQEQFCLNVESKIKVDENKIVVPVGVTTVDIGYIVETNISNIVTDGLSNSGRYIYNVTVVGHGKEKPFRNESLEDIPLPNLNQAFTKTVNVENYEIGVEEKFILKASSHVTTHDDSVLSDEADPVVIKIIVVANDFVDFIIKRNETDVTGGTIVVDNIANPNVTLTLKDTSFVESGEVTKRVWKYDTPSGEVTINGGNETITNFTITGSNKSCIIDGTVTFIEYVHTAKGFVDSMQHIVNIKEKEPTSSGGVVAVLTSDADFNERENYYEVMEGQVFRVKGNKSYHTAELDIEDYDFDIGEDFNEGILLKKYNKQAKVFYPNKENRKLSFFVENKNNLTFYPIDEKSLKWTITPLDGQGNVFSTKSSLHGMANFDGQFAKKGRYKVRVEGEIESNYNTERPQGSAEVIINILEDFKPIADFDTKNIIYRDIKNNNVRKIYASDKSYSLDDDNIVQRIWSITFDENNNDDFSDDSPIVYSVANDRHPYYESDHVGNYKIELKVKEEFGQASILEFVTDLDKRRGDTASKAYEEKTIEMRNVAPIVAMEVTGKKQVNVIVYEDLQGDEKLSLESSMDELKASLYEKKLNMNTHYIQPTETVGNRKVWTTYFDSYINVQVHAIGDDEDRDEIDWVQDMRFFLDSYTSEDDKDVVATKDPNRFELVDVKWGRSYYRKYKYKDRSKDYEDYKWKELIVTYRENGVEKEKTYNYVYEYEKRDTYGSSNRHDAFDYDSYDIVSTNLVVNEPIVDRHKFVEENNTFRYGAEVRPTITQPTKTSRTVQLKKYSTSDLNSILSDCENEDTFFLNLTSKEENRIALDKTLEDKLKSNNITYLTLSKDLVLINPLSGRFDELAMGNMIAKGEDRRYNWIYYANELIVRLGTSSYRLDEMYSAYLDMGDFESAKERMGVENDSLVEDAMDHTPYT